MSKPTNRVEPIINPQNTKWKFFRLNAEKEVVCSDEKPTDVEVMAIINTSAWFGNKSNNRGDTPGVVKKLINKTLKFDLGDGRKPKLSIAVPVSEIEEMREYYGKESGFSIPGILSNENLDQYKMDFSVVEDDYVAVRMHDDLRKGDFKFIVGSKQESPIGTMPAKEGAEQIASAIENGFNIWTVAGGNSIFPKLQLCEQYFSSKSADELAEIKSDKKPYLIGFSNVSTTQFYLRGLITPIHYSGMRTAIFSDKEFNNILLRALEGEENLTHERVLETKDVGVVHKRYLDKIREGDVITNITFFPYVLGLAIDSTFPKFKDNEKLIIGLEGYLQNPTWSSPSDVLFKALESGALKQEQILFVSIEDLMLVDEQFEVEKVNGLIPDNFESLSEGAKKCITSQAEKFVMTKEEYIQKSNEVFLAEVARIEEVANHFGIPVVFGGAQRSGHSRDQIIQPSRVTSLEFREDGKIIQTSTFVRENKEILFSSERKTPDCPAPDWSILSAPPVAESGEFKFVTPSVIEFSKDLAAIRVEEIEIAQQEIRNARLKLLTTEFPMIELGEEKVIAGSSLNIAELSDGAIANRGIMIQVPYSSFIHQPAIFYQTIFSNQLNAAKFVVLSLEIPEALTGSTREEFVKSRNDMLQKLCEDCRVEKPIFVTLNSLDQSKLSPLFEAEIDLQRMVVPSENIAVTQSTMFAAASLEASHER